jgi:NAD-dependent SIR2 family protein deacetylase
MFCFLIGGIEATKIQRLEANAGTCPYWECHGSLDRMEVTNTLKLFYVPVYTYKPEQFYLCRQCRSMINKEAYITDYVTNNS